MISLYSVVTGDLFHRGHVAFFKKARELGDHLTVGVCSDEEVTSYKRKPILNLNERKEVIEACRYVDAVIAPAPAITTLMYIEQHKFDLVIASKSYTDKVLETYYPGLLDLELIKLIEYEKGISTTAIIERCAKAYNDASGKLTIF